MPLEFIRKLRGIHAAIYPSIGMLISLVLITGFSSCVERGTVQEMENQYGIYKLYVPHSYSPSESNVVVVVHGTPEKNDEATDLALTFINRWLTFADSTGSVIVAPAFDKVNYASDSGAGGGYRSLYGRVVGADEFLNSIIDEVRVLSPTSESRFYLYGHSAGGQFASRYLVRHPEKLLGVVLSAPGRYPFPVEEAAWPYGMGEVSGHITWPDGEQQQIDISPDLDGWRQASELPVTVVIGELDTASQPCRSAHCADNVSQSTRIEIGEKWVDNMRDFAESKGNVARYYFLLVPGIGHNSAALTGNCQDVFYNLLADRIRVPKVVGMHERQAIDVLESVEFQGRRGQGMLSQRPRGEIVFQLPVAGTWADKGDPVVVNPSLGVEQPPERTTVPDVVGQALNTASSAIKAAGFQPVPIVVDSDRPFQEVVGQSPEGGDRAVPGSNVQIFFSKGPGDIERR